jgi:hypothetical protein
MSARAPAAGHRFSLGDAVLFSPDGSDGLYEIAATGKVTRLLPKDGLEYQYHIQFGPDGQQRRALESQLRLLSGTTA